MTPKIVPRALGALAGAELGQRHARLLGKAFVALVACRHSDRDTGRPRGFAFVEFESDPALEAAMQLNGARAAPAAHESCGRGADLPSPPPAAQARRCTADR